jgi:hypothetical protein
MQCQSPFTSTEDSLFLIVWTARVAFIQDRLTTDYYEDASTELWYEGEDRRFRVDWSFVDAQQLENVILEAPGFRVDGEVDLSADWDTVRTQMRRFHGYPYTSVGIALVNV